MSYGTSICVYCGARNGVRPAYRSAASHLGKALASRGWRLVYGAGEIGLMGTVASAAREAGGEVLGVIPAHLVSREGTKPDLTRLIVTENMHERKMHMFRNSQATVVLPGGAGTLEEFLEILTWRQLGLHSKPIHVLNTEGYWDRLIQLLEHVIDKGFADPSLRGYVSVAACVPDLIEGLCADLSRRSPANE